MEDESEDGNEDEIEDSSFGKRKADDFLKRQERTMDATFKAYVVLPGDDVTGTMTRCGDCGTPARFRNRVVGSERLL